MNKRDQFFVCFLILLFVFTMIYGFLHFLDLNDFWKISFEKLVGLFSTLVVGISSIYITVMLNAKNNTYKKKIEFLEEQIKKLIHDFDDTFDVFGGSRNGISKEFYLNKLTKISDIITITLNTKEIFEKKKSLFKENNKINNFFQKIEQIQKSFNEYQERVTEWYYGKINCQDELKKMKAAILVLSNDSLIEIIGMY